MLTYEDVMNDNVRLQEQIKRLQAESARLKGLLENSEMTVAEVIDANERLREALKAALREIGNVEANICDVTPGTVDLMRAALAPSPVTPAQCTEPPTS